MTDWNKLNAELEVVLDQWEEETKRVSTELVNGLRTVADGHMDGENNEQVVIFLQSRVTEYKKRLEAFTDTLEQT